MFDNQPSRTSIVVASLRAFGARDPDPTVRNPDFLAERLIGPDELDLIKEHPISSALLADYTKSRKIQEVSGMSNLLLIRTRFIDDEMKRALAGGATQVVILGAGFDTRAYRFAELLQDRKVFEVDIRSTQQIKRRRLEAARIDIPANLRYVEIDFKTDKLRDVLSAAGYDPSQKTFFIWEGVSMYLAEDTVRATLRTISGFSMRGSSLAMDFAGQAMVEMLRDLPNLSQHRYTSKWGEPWIFGVPDQRESEFFRECGFNPREILMFFSREATQRYLTRADGTNLGTVRGGQPPLGTLIPMIYRFITRRSKWLALAALDVV